MPDFSLTADEALDLDVGIRTYAVDWHQGTPVPMLVESRGYPVYRCVREVPA
jgi:hypothetical protein